MHIQFMYIKLAFMPFPKDSISFLKFCRSESSAISRVSVCSFSACYKVFVEIPSRKKVVKFCTLRKIFTWLFCVKTLAKFFNSTIFINNISFCVNFGAIYCTWKQIFVVRKSLCFMKKLAKFCISTMFINNISFCIFGAKYCMQKHIFVVRNWTPFSKQTVHFENF